MFIFFAFKLRIKQKDLHQNNLLLLFWTEITTLLLEREEGKWNENNRRNDFWDTFVEIGAVQCRCIRELVKENKQRNISSIINVLISPRSEHYFPKFLRCQCLHACNAGIIAIKHAKTRPVYRATWKKVERGSGKAPVARNGYSGRII